MFESNSKLPKIFVYMLSAVAAFMFVGLFFGVGYVRIPYFIAAIICVIMLVLDKKSDSNLTNYKLTYLLFGLVNLLAVISVIYYEFTKYSKVLNVFLVLLIVVEVLLAVVDLFVLKNKYLTKKFNLTIDFVRLGSMICIMTYFFGVSDFYFAIFAFAFELANMAVKVLTFFKHKENKEVIEEKTEEIEDIIHSSDEEDGE
jgi:hypothetical protein